MDLKEIQRFIVDKNKISPFPKCSKEEFSLKETFFLPQDLQVLREITNIPDLSWTFDEKSVEDRAVYSKAYQHAYFGSLGLLFFRELDFRLVALLPENWSEDRIRGHIKEKELETWDQVLLYLGQAQYCYYLMNKLNEEKKELEEYDQGIDNP